MGSLVLCMKVIFNPSFLGTHQTNFKLEVVLQRMWFPQVLEHLCNEDDMFPHQYLD